jgi:hypothetical protein
MNDPSPVFVGYSNPNAPMVKPTQDWQGEHPPSPLEATRNRCVFFQRHMRAGVEQMAEMLLPKDHDVIEAVPPDRSDQPFHESIIKSS